MSAGVTNAVSPLFDSKFNGQAESPLDTFQSSLYG